MTRVLEVGQYVGGRRILSLRSTKQRGWRATDEYGRSYYQRGPDSYPDGLHTKTELGVTLSSWPPSEAKPRKRMAGTSQAKRKEIAESRPVVAAVMERDGGCVLRDHAEVWGDCRGVLDPHHIHKAVQGGLYSLTNCVTLCRIHNQCVEDQPALAKEWGLVVNHAIPATEARTRRVAHGLPAALPDDFPGGDL